MTRAIRRPPPKCGLTREGVAALINRIPVLDLKWPQEHQQMWWSWIRLLWDESKRLGMHT